MSKQKEQDRPTQEQREAVAQNIREGGDSATEVIMEEIGLSEGTPILDEAAKEQAEGGGPIAEAVAEVNAQLDSDDD